MKKHFITIFAVLTVAFAFGQQDAQYSFYMFNNLYFNPAYAGKKEAVNFEVLHRQQWQFFNIGAEIDGAPQSTSLSFHAPFKRASNALGFTFHNDIVGPFVNSKFSLSYAYRIPIGQKLKLSIGINGGYALYHRRQVDFGPDPDGVADEFNDNPNVGKLNAGAGIYFWNKNDRWYIGASVPHLLQNKLYKDDAFGNGNSAQEYLHYYATAGFVIGKKDANFMFYPSTLMKMNIGSPLDFDVNANFLLYQRLWIGAGYRFGGDVIDPVTGQKFFGRGSDVIGMIRMKIVENLEMGYAYDHSLSNLNQYNSGSHEILLNFNINKSHPGADGVRITTPRYINYF